MRTKALCVAAGLTIALLAIPQTALKPGEAGQKAGAPAMKPPPPPKPAWQEFKLNPRTTMFLDFTESNPDMVISIFSRTSGITILKDPQFKIPLTVTSAKAVSLNEAFEIFNTVLGLNGYELRKQGNLMLVAKKQPAMVAGGPPPPPPPAPIVKTYQLKNANAAQVARVVNDVFGQGGAAAPAGPQPGVISFGPGGPMPSPQGGGPGAAGNRNAVKASSEDYSNAVIVSALPNDHTNVEALIKDLDKPTTTPLESEVFPLRYVPAEDVLPAIEDVLTSNAPLGRGMNRGGNQSSNFFFFNPFGNNRQRNPGGQTATAIKPTNSVIVTALKENIETVRKLLANLDQPGNYVGTTFVIKLENAKAADVADILNRAFAARRNPNQDNPFFFFSDFGSNQRKETSTADLNERGEVVNVRDIVGNVTIIADPNTNSLVIVSQPSNMRYIREVVDRLDHVAEQVMIETVIVEANLDKSSKLGVEWNFESKKLGSDSRISGSGSTTFGLQGATPPLEGLRYTITHKDYRVFLNLIQTDTKFKVLDTPKIFTSNNVKAEINVSQKLPYITSQQTGIGGNLLTTYNFQDVGVILTVTPRITSSGHVIMEVVQSADDLQGFTNFNAPIINHRQASTTVTVADGETIVLGGIIRHTQNRTEKRVPLLGDIPLFGNLFKSTSKTDVQTELMVFLTPRIVRSVSEAKRLRDEETKRLSKESQDNLKKHVPPPVAGR